MDEEAKKPLMSSNGSTEGVGEDGESYKLENSKKSQRAALDNGEHSYSSFPDPRVPPIQKVRVTDRVACTLCNRNSQNSFRSHVIDYATLGPRDWRLLSLVVIGCRHSLQLAS